MSGGVVDFFPRKRRCSKSMSNKMPGTLGSNQLKTLWKLDHRHKLLTSINDQKSVGGRKLVAFHPVLLCRKIRRNVLIQINNHAK